MLSNKSTDILAYKPPGSFEETRFEKLHNVIFENSTEASFQVAASIAALIKEKHQVGEPCVLGLATGSTPLSVYRELVRLHKEEGLSFQNVVSFNLDEYFPLSKNDLQSYHHFMHVNLFDHIDILPENIHIPNGEVEAKNVRAFCIEYENKQDAGQDVTISL